MERSRSLSTVQEGATDGGTDISGKSSGNQAHSTSSSGHLENKVTSSLLTASLHWETSPGSSSYLHNENENVKSSFSNTGPDRLSEALRDFSQPYLRWMSNKFGESTLFTYTDVSSFVYTATYDQTHTSTLETSLAPTPGHPQLIPTSSALYSQQPLLSSSATFQQNPPGGKITSVSDSAVFYATRLETHSPACSRCVTYLQPSNSFLVDSAFDELQAAVNKSTFDLNTVRTIVTTSSESDLAAVNTEFSITLNDTGANSKSSTQTTNNIRKAWKPTLKNSLPTIVSTDASSHRGSTVQSLSKLTEELWHSEGSKLTSGKIYDPRTSPLLDGFLVSGATGASLPIFRDLIVVATGASVLTEESNHSTVSVITTLFPSSFFTFSNAYIDDYSLTQSDQLFTTLPGDDSQEVNRLERTAEDNSSAISSARPAESDCLSVVESLHSTSGVYISPSQPFVNQRLSAEIFPMLRNNMEISTVSSISLQPSSTLSYNFTFSEVSSQGIRNINKWAAVLNDPVAETTSYQPLSLQSTTVEQAMTPGDASHPTLVQANPSVSPSTAMFITLEKSSALSSVTDVFPASSRVTSTQKMNIADGESSSRPVPNFNTPMIIASACAVLALVIFVIITICCLRRKRRSKSSTCRQEGDDLWVDLYRNNSWHQMPLPSLTTCPSSFEMTDALSPAADSTEVVTDSKHNDTHTSQAGSSVGNQMKSQRQISSFQIKNPKVETEQELEPTHSVSELGFSEDHAEIWVKMATSLSMTSLPTTEVSYHTNITDYNLAVVGQKFRAVYNYKPVCKGEMALKEGELVECKERDRNGWMLGYKSRTNEEGWFPAVYVDELSSDDDLDFTCEIPETYDILESNKLNSTDQYWTGIEHRVCYDYRSSVPGDLDLEPGQIIIVLQTLANGWWFAVSGNKCGWFPGSYVEIIIDSSTEEPPSDGDLYQVNDHTRVNTETQGTVAAQTSEDKPDTANASLASISELPEEKENVNEDETKPSKTDIADETSKLNVSTSTEILVRDKLGLKESICAADTHEPESTVLFTSNQQTVEKSDTRSAESVSIISATNVGNDKSSHSQKRQEHSLRPARPAPPPPKNKDSKAKKDDSGDNDSQMQTGNIPDPVLKKPIMLIHGKKPKMHKVLRSQLDEKQLNPMIRPSTRGFMPKPTAHTHNGFRQEHSSTTEEHAHSLSSITHDLHSERPMFSQAHSSVRRLSPFQPLNLQSLSQQEQTSSQTSLGSCPETKLVYPRGSTPHNEQDKVNHSNTNYFSQERSLTPDYRRERSLTPDYKRDRSNSPVLLTTGNLLQNVQRFHGALKHPTPLGNEKGSLKGLSAEKKDREYALANTYPNTLSTFSHQQQAAPAAAPNLKTPPVNRVHIKKTLGGLHDQNYKDNSMKAAYNYEPLNEHPHSEHMLPTNMLPTYTDSIRGNMSHRKEHASKYSNSDNTSLNQESFTVTPGTVFEIVQQINKHTPLQTELLQKLKSNKKQSEPSDFPVKQNILTETHVHKLLPTDQSHSATPNNGFSDTTSSNDSIPAL